MPVNGFFLYGQYAKNLMIKDGFKEHKLNVVYNSLDYEKTAEIRKAIHKTNLFENYFSNKLPVIVFIGRIQKNKKLEMLISFLKEQKLKGEIYNLDLIGEGNDKEELLNLLIQTYASNACTTKRERRNIERALKQHNNQFPERPLSQPSYSVMILLIACLFLALVLLFLIILTLLLYHIL